MFDYKKIVRLKILNQPGVLGKIADTVGNYGGNLGDIGIVRLGTKYRIRDVTIYTKTPNQFEEILWKLRELKEIKVIEVFNDILKAHEGGLIEVKNKINIENDLDFQKYYLPGIVEIAKVIEETKEKLYEYTNVGNLIGIVSNGTSLLNFKKAACSEATYSVMEAMSSVLNKFANISAVPIVVNTEDIDEFINTIKNIYRSFGIIILEDISSPGSMEIEERLQELVDIPVIDTNRYGNAIVTLSALINIANKVGIDLRSSKVGLLGFGSKAAGICNVLKAYGVQDIVSHDVKEEAIKRMEKYGAESVSFDKLLKESNIIIGVSRVGGLIKFGMVRKGQIILSLSKPNPEIEPGIAMKAGALYAGDGKMVTPFLAVPGLLRGTLLARAKKVTLNMMITAAEKIAELAHDGEILPNIFDKDIHEEVAKVVKQAAMDEGVANLWEIDIEDEKDEEKAENILNMLGNDWTVS